MFLYTMWNDLELDSVEAFLSRLQEKSVKSDGEDNIESMVLTRHDLERIFGWSFKIFQA